MNEETNRIPDDELEQVVGGVSIEFPGEPGLSAAEDLRLLGAEDPEEKKKKKIPRISATRRERK